MSIIQRYKTYSQSNGSCRTPSIIGRATPWIIVRRSRPTLLTEALVVGGVPNGDAWDFGKTVILFHSTPDDHSEFLIHTPDDDALEIVSVTYDSQSEAQSGMHRSFFQTRQEHKNSYNDSLGDSRYLNNRITISGRLRMRTSDLETNILVFRTLCGDLHPAW